jgi:hypothetical protein
MAAPRMRRKLREATVSVLRRLSGGKYILGAPEEFVEYGKSWQLLCHSGMVDHLTYTF